MDATERRAGPARRGALALLLAGLLAVGGVTAASVARVGPFAGPDDEPPEATADATEPGSDGTVEDDAAESEARRLARRRLRPGASRDGDDAAARTDGSTQDDAPAGEALTPQIGPPPKATFAGVALRAHLDVAEGATESEARAVAPGRPPLVRLGDFVREGHRRTRGAVELVGAREPELEQGVPVAITGRVLEEETDDPIAGATVLVTSTFYVRQIQYDHHLREVARVETDANGTFTIDRLNADPAHFGAGGRVYVTVVHPGHATALAMPLAEVTPGFANELPDIVLTRETHTLRGRVTDHWKRQPVVGARVLATGAVNPISYPKDQRDALFLAAPETVTDEEGRFELTGLRAGVQHVSLHAGDDCIANGAFTVPSDDEVTLRGHPIRGRIEGRVVDAEGEPIPLAIVSGGWNNTHSFADGRFVLENFSGEIVELVISHAEYRELRVPQVADDRTGLELRLERRVPLVRLHVRGQDEDEPLQHVQVVLIPTDDQRPQVTASPHFLATDGVHTVRVPDGVARLVVTAEGFAPHELDAAGMADGDRIDVLLTPAE